MSNISIFCETGFEITYFYSFQFFCLFVSKTNFLTGIFHNTPKYFDFLLRFWHVQFEGFARLADVQSVGKKSHLDLLYHALMTDDYGSLVEHEVLREKFASVPVCLITNPPHICQRWETSDWISDSWWLVTSLATDEFNANFISLDSMVFTHLALWCVQKKNCAQTPSNRNWRHSSKFQQINSKVLRNDVFSQRRINKQISYMC